MSKKIFIHVDMNAFFASIEQRDFPKLQGMPIAVTNGKHGSCIITSSYEARAFGVKTGMRLCDGKKICPPLIQRPSRPNVYAEVSTNIMNILQTITPDIQIYSVDEAFLEVTNCMRIYKKYIGIYRGIYRRNSYYIATVIWSSAVIPFALPCLCLCPALHCLAFAFACVRLFCFALPCFALPCTA